MVGARGKKYHAEKPFGMTLIPGGSFIMGKSDDDLLGINDAPTKTVTVRSYYMDETEITNSEYRQFVDWVRDSVIRRRLAIKAVDVLGDNLANSHLHRLKHVLNRGKYLQSSSWSRRWGCIRFCRGGALDFILG